MSSRLDAGPDSNSEISGERHVATETELTSRRGVVNTYQSVEQSEIQRQEFFDGPTVIPTQDCDLGEGEFVVVDQHKPGLALLLGFETFSNGEQSRPGVVRDLQNMYQLFHTYLGFEVQTMKDLTGAECEEWIRKVTSDNDLLERISCVVMVISSHGSEEEIQKEKTPGMEFRQKEIKFYQHQISTRDGSIETSKIVNMFDNPRCRALRGKPKVFFIQACRSRTDEAKSVYDFVDSGVPIRIQSEDGYEAQPSKGPTLSTHHNPVVQCESDESRVDAKGIRAQNIHFRGKRYMDLLQPAHSTMEDQIVVAPPPCLHNSVIVMASPPGKAAWSESIEGGWLILGLYQVLMQYVRDRHKIRLLQALTRVNYFIALTLQSNTNDPSLNAMKCMPVMTHTLERDIVIVPKNLQRIDTPPDLQNTVIQP